MEPSAEVYACCGCEHRELGKCIIPDAPQNSTIGPAFQPGKTMVEKVQTTEPRQYDIRGKVLLAWALTVRYYCGCSTLNFLVLGTPTRYETLDSEFHNLARFGRSKGLEVKIIDTSIAISDLAELIEDSVNREPEHSCRSITKDPRNWLSVVRFAKNIVDVSEVSF